MAAARDRVPLARARAQTDAFVDDFDWSFVSVDGLSVVDAWSMATAWQTALQGHLSVDVGFDFQITTPNYHWVQLWLGCGDADMDMDRATQVAGAARATSLVWRALAACRGFGAQEFPVFWKRVVDAIQRPRDPATATGDGTGCTDVHVRADDYVMDAKGFFDGVAFPRFHVQLGSQLNADGMDKMMRVFCGMDASDSTMVQQQQEQQEHQQQEKLQPILHWLSRLARPEATRLPMELVLRFNLENTTTLRANTLLREIQTRAQESPPPSQASPPSRILNADDETESAETVLYDLSQPQYVVVAVDPMFLRWRTEFNGEWIYTDDHAREYLEYGQSLDAPISSQRVASFQHDTAENRHIFRAFVEQALALNKTETKSRTGVKTLRFIAQNYSPWAIGAMFSALPYARSLVNFGVESFGSYYGDEARIPKDVATWLAYALFHPDTSGSTWKSLQFNLVKFAIGSEVQVKHEMMARGNNLLVALGLVAEATATEEQPVVVVDAYYSATVRQGTAIYSTKPREEQQQADDADAVVIQVVDSAGPFQLDVCVATTDVASLDNYVAVVVAGYGLAWIQSSDIESIIARPPGPAFLTGLRIAESDLSDRYVVALVQSAGRELQCLDLKGNYYYPIVPGLAESCPRLEKLGLKDTSEMSYPEIWTGSPCMRLGSQIPPTVRELHLYFPDSFESLDKVVASSVWARDLPNLETLYMACRRLPTDTELDDFVRPALRDLPRLQNIMWLNLQAQEDRQGRRVPTPSLSYAQMRYVARSAIAREGLSADEEIAVVTSSRAPAVALLSVVDAAVVDQEDQRAIGRLSRELVRHIMAFARSTVPRQLWFYQNTA